MTLLELLVKELPKRGGWPKGAEAITQDSDKAINKYNTADGLKTNEYGTWEYSSAWLDWLPVSKGASISLASDYATAIITREQYEAELAASKQEWNGEGLPPVGCEFEYGTHRTRAKCLGIGHHMVFASKGDPDDEDGDFEEFMISILDSEFRPIRSGADKRRAEGVIALSRVDPQAMPFEYGDKHPDGSLIGPFWYDLYDAIAAGKIPGVKLED